ncbi:MAG: Flp family type IVb pilin [Microthrixaceae bacterium]
MRRLRFCAADADEVSMGPRPEPTTTDPPTASPPVRRARRRRSERGASLVEYALLVAALAVPTVAALDLMRDSTAAKVDQTAEDMSDPTIPMP